MSHATLIYPHQLYADHPTISAGRPIFLIEEPLFLREFPAHRQKLLLHRLSMTAYATRLRALGHNVTIVPHSSLTSTASIFEWLTAHAFTDVHITDTTDDWLEARITAACAEYTLTRHSYESPLFYLPRQEAIDRYRHSKRHLARFYESIRRDTNILMETDRSPTGGRFSFDSENRKKIPKGVVLPNDPAFYTDDAVTAALAWLEQIPGEHYGETQVWLPYTHESAAAWLLNFLSERFNGFGPYEDAITADQVRLWHSTISPLLNIGLLTPQQVVKNALAQAKENNVPLASLEGFIRQILGWREFIRAAYEAEGRTMRSQNFWHHTRPLPSSFWDGTTGIDPVDNSIKKARGFGYTHHIERLMIVGNFMLLSEIDPHEVYRWFMAMYVDAYDWVMVPNVYGMSQFADGGSFATKPYISGSNYIRKMSQYKPDDWSRIWDALYWNFIAKHKDFFTNNHRLSMMPRLLEKMSTEARTTHLDLAKRFLADLV